MSNFVVVAIVFAYSTASFGVDDSADFFKNRSGASSTEIDLLRTALDANDFGYYKMFLKDPVVGCLGLVKGEREGLLDYTKYRHMVGSQTPAEQIREIVWLAKNVCEKVVEKTILNERFLDSKSFVLYQGVRDLRVLDWHCHVKDWEAYFKEKADYDLIFEPDYLKSKPYLSEISGRCDKDAERYAEEKAARDVIENELERQRQFAAAESRRKAEEMIENAERRASEKAAVQFERYKADIEAKARNLGYRSVSFDGLTELIDYAIHNALPIEDVSRILVRISSDDRRFEVKQVISSREAIMMSAKSKSVLIVQDVRKTLYEGTKLDAFDVKYFSIVGLRTYTTAIGSSKQAFVVKPVYVE